MRVNGSLIEENQRYNINHYVIFVGFWGVGVFLQEQIPGNLPNPGETLGVDLGQRDGYS